MQDRFRVDQIQLSDFRCFEHFVLDLHPELTLLVGPNGQGKTAVLDALAAVAGATDRSPQLSGLPLVRSDVRFGARHGALLDAHVQRDGGPRRFRVSIPPSGEAKSLTQIPTNAAAFPEAMPYPILVRYGADRLVTGTARVDDRTPPNAAAWWDPRPFWSDLVTWIRRETFAEIQQGAPGPALHVVRSAIEGVLAQRGITDLRYDIGSETLMVTVEGRAVPFDVASGGVRALVAVVADLATRCYLKNAFLPSPAESPGLVLLDEVELHLHPRWQREFLPALRRVFPNLQIVATTHSPQVVASVDAESVRVLTASGVGRIERSRGRDANSVLEDAFGVAPRPDDAQERLHSLFVLIDAQDPRAPERLAEAEELYGRDDPDVARARFLLEMGG